MIRGALVLGLCVAFQAEALAQNNETTGPYENEHSYLVDLFDNTTFIPGDKAIGIIEGVGLQLIDSVSDGCWTNLNVVRARLRAELERNGIAVYEEELATGLPTFPTLLFEGLGFKVGPDVCVGNYSIKAFAVGASRLGSITTGGVFEILGSQTMWEPNSVLATRSQSLNEVALEYAQQWVDTFVADIAAASRDDRVRRFREVWEYTEPMTLEEWKKQNP